MEPIVLAGLEVRGILHNGLKQISRLVRPQPKKSSEEGWWDWLLEPTEPTEPVLENNHCAYERDMLREDILPHCGPYTKGLQFWVQEDWFQEPEAVGVPSGTVPGDGLHYREPACVADLGWFEEKGWEWFRADSMPQEASRFSIEIIRVRIFVAAGGGWYRLLEVKQI